MGASLWTCKSEEQLQACQAQLGTSRQETNQAQLECQVRRTADRVACDQACRNVVALTDGLVRLEARMQVIGGLGGLRRFVGHIIHPVDAQTGWGPCPTTLGHGCLKARVLCNTLRLSTERLPLSPPEPSSDAAVLTVDFQEAARVTIGIQSVAEARAEQPVARYLVSSADNALTVRPAPSWWYLGQDAALPRWDQGPWLWLQFLTDSDPARATMLALADDTTLRLVPLASPLATLPFMIQDARKTDPSVLDALRPVG